MPIPGIAFAIISDMHKGIYIALSGATLKQTELDVISNNLANASTSGFKKDKVSFRDFLISRLNNISDVSDARVMSDLSGLSTDLSEGSIVRTGNPLDIAIEGSGFLSLEGGRYTRRGDLRLDRDGYLVTQRGIKVLGARGPIMIPGGSFDVGSSGEISSDGVLIDKLKVVDFKDAGGLRKAGEDLFIADGQGVTARADVKQGYIEKSNVEVVREMVRMITALREFESYQKLIQAFDDSIAKVLADVGRI